MINAEHIVSAVTAYHPEADTEALRRACELCMKAHAPQFRASGEPYYTHPFAVAMLLTGLRLDVPTVITGLLHDTVEDTEVTTEQIAESFGPGVAALVDGVTKLAQIKFKSEQEKQAENFRKLLLAMSEDIRVLIVKLADRLHNMQTLHYVQSPDKRRRIARETMEIYAPLAERVGIQQFRNELQELAFKELYPEIRESIQSRLEYLRSKHPEGMAAGEREICRILEEAGCSYVSVTGREKAPCSIWRKMERKRINFEQLADVTAYRVIAADVAGCYAVMGALHVAYKVVPGRFKDYISLPKTNGYRSLHTVIMGPEQQAVEVQIRTQEMQDVAEYGVAAHWGYKQNQDVTDGRQYRWVRELLYILENSSDTEDFMESTKLEMYFDQVFCFTPKGDLIALPRGATGVDFAYHLHSDIGNRCAGVKINGHVRPLHTRLANGDQVEVITSDMQLPSADWLKFVVTARAKSEISRFVRARKREEYIKLGRSLAEREAQAAGITGEVTAAFEEARKRLRRKTVEDMLAAVGQGNLAPYEIFRREGEAKPKDRGTAGPSLIDRFIAGGARRRPASGAVPIKGLIPGMAVHFADCCNPIPGDNIVGVVISGKGLTIHTADCEALSGVMGSPERLIDVSWDSAGRQDAGFLGRIQVTLTHESGTLGRLAQIVAQNGGNITNLKITARATDFFEILLDVEVKGARQLEDVITSLRVCPYIQSVRRYKS